MNRIEKLRYARRVLMMQDRIALRFRPIITKELKRVARRLSESYMTNHSQVEFDKITLEHKNNLASILEQLAKTTADTFKSNTRLSQKNVFDNYVENAIYMALAQNVISTATSVSAITVAAASAVIMQRMTQAAVNPSDAEPENVAKAISQKVSNTSVSRAMTIARTETHKAANVSEFTRAKEASVDAGLNVIVEWLSTNDGRVRDSHKHANGQKRPIGQSFLVGGDAMKHPADPSASAANTINCRCVLSYSVEQ